MGPQRIRSVLGGVKLRSGGSTVPSTLSNKRGREATVTETLIAEPTVVLTSRPAKGLSSRARLRIVDLLGDYISSFKRALVVVARSRAVTRVTSRVVVVRSNGTIEEW